jgi:regulator of RNase E activity RraB
MPSFFDRFRRSDVFEGDRDLIKHMLDDGQQLATRPRETTHYLHFATHDAALGAADKAQALGFDIDIEGPEGRRDFWQVLAKHTILVTEETITTARRTLTPVAEAAGGVYDGWDTYADEALDQMAAGDSPSDRGFVS